MLGWIAHATVQRGGKLREPMIGESFAAIDSVAECLLREAVQNSLDARQDRTSPVRIRLYVSGVAGALPADAADEWFRGAWQHFRADPKVRLRVAGEACRFVVVEDFNTSGLEGDETSSSSADESPNHWCLFFRKEGQSQKGEGDRGRWGVGKVVFPLSSRVHAFIGATVRSSDDRRLVMGQAMLRSRLIDGRQYDPDLWYCKPGTNGFELPSEDAEDFDKLKAAFRLERTTQPGLSIVIPFADDEITKDALVLAAIREFFYPILTGLLVIEVEAHGEERITLDAGSISAEVGRFSAEARGSLAEHIDMARWLITRSAPLPSADMPSEDGALRWSHSQIGQDLLTSLRASLDAGDTVGIRLPTSVIQKSGARTRSFIDVVLRRAGDSSPRRPTYVRSGLIIPEVKSRQLRGFHGLIVAEDMAVCTMLGDAENPAHTDWVKNSSNFKDRYKFAPSQLDYVKHSATNVCLALTAADSVVHTTALVDYFSIPKAAEDGAPRRKRAGRGNGTGQGGTGGGTGPGARPRAFRLERVTGGFTVTSTDTRVASGKGLLVSAAYAVRSGNPLAKHSAADFQMTSLTRSLAGLAVAQMTDNSLLLRPVESSFRLELTGFDPNRDLFVRVREESIDS